MKPDPFDSYTVTSITAPPSQGPGSGKPAWVAYALERAKTCATLWGILDDQAATIKELRAEIELLRHQIATRKPKGGRPRITDQKVNQIEADLSAGYTKRSIAARHRVSAMTVVRVAARVAERAQ